jgi:trigger factor
MERLPESQVVLDITAEEEEYGKALDKATRSVLREVQVPGFRKGKVPRHMVERMFGREIFVEEANRHLMDDLYRQAIKQVQESEEFVPVGDPSIEIVAPEPLEFKVTIPVFPTVDVGDYTGVRVEPKDATVEESEVDEVIARLQKSQSPWADPAEPRTPREGDQVTIDLSVTEGEEQFQDPLTDGVFVLGESNLMEAVRERIEGLQVDESATFDLVFEDDDESVNERMRGKQLTYTVTLKGLKERQLLPLDDDFAKSVGDADTLEELRQEIRDDLHRGKSADLRTEVLNEIISAMAAGAQIEPPAIMIDEAVTDQINELRGRLAQQRLTLDVYLRANNQTEAELREQLRPDAARRLRNSLMIREIAEREGIEIADEDVDKEVEDLSGTAEASGASEQVMGLYRSDYFRRVLRNDLYERRVTDRLIEIATEGQGAVRNAWTPPPPSETPADETTDAGEATFEPVLTGEPVTVEEAGGGMTPLAQAEAASADVATADGADEPDTAQAASTGHEAEYVAAEGRPADADRAPESGDTSPGR